MKLEDLKKITAHLSYPVTPESFEDLKLRMREMGLDPDNLYQELEMSSRFVDTHRDVSHSNDTVLLHSHTFYEIILCRNTCGVEYLVGSERYQIQKGDIILVPPFISHRPLLPDTLPEPYTRDVVWISTEFVDTISQLFPHSNRTGTGSSFLRTAGTKWEYICDLIHSGVQEAEQHSPGWEMIVFGNTISLMTHLKRAFLDEATPPIPAETPGLLDRAMAYIEENLSQRITIEEAARHLYISESTLSQTFRKKMGVSFYRCVTQRRLISAKALILENVPLEQAGEQVGFSDYSGFYRAFKQEYGISPRQFRKLQESSSSSAL